MEKTTSVLIVGVGGQGVITASEVFAKVAMLSGYDVKKSEIHGMSQRGGSVSSHIRFNKVRVYSPVAPKGEVDFLMSFEKLEALRWIDFLKEEGIVIVNDFRWDPLPVSSGEEPYPEGVIEKIRERRNAIIFKATELAKELGNIRVTNTILLGTLARQLPFDKEVWLKVIEERVPPKTVEINKRAFEEGYKKEI